PGRWLGHRRVQGRRARQLRAGRPQPVPRLPQGHAGHPQGRWREERGHLQRPAARHRVPGRRAPGRPPLSNEGTTTVRSTLLATTTALLLALAPALPVAGATDAAAAGAGIGWRAVPGGMFRSAVRFEDDRQMLPVAPFQLMERPVSNAQFAAFLARQPQWRRDRIPALFSSPGYLAHWESADAPGARLEADAPVVHVNWYAADAFCRDASGHLPDFIEWEYAAAADATRADARHDRQWRLRQANDGTPHAPDAVPDAPANVHGLRGMHGAYWEWTGDATSLL